MDPKYEFKKSIERIRHELLLVNNRVNWLIGSQTFFIGTYLILLDKTESNAQLFNAVNIVPIIGAIFAFVVYVGVMAALIVIRRTVREARNLDLIAYPDTYSASLLRSDYNTSYISSMVALFIIWARNNDHIGFSNINNNLHFIV